LAVAAAGQRHLAAQVAGYRLTGYSTHINVEVADRRVAAVARLVARRLALPIMLSLDRTNSPGLLIRPRPGRLEVGGEFASGDQLRAAVVMTIGMVMLAERSLRFRWRLPTVPGVNPEPAVERYGWYVDRRAFGPDLYQHGRSTRVGVELAADVLTRLWAAAKTAIGDRLSSEELGLVDALAAGERPLPLEQPADGDGPTATVRLNRSYAPRQRGDIEVSVYRATWWKAVLALRRGDVRRWLTLPGRTLDAVLDAVDTGALDDDLARMVP
jgi:hypothetical protein